MEFPTSKSDSVQLKLMKLNWARQREFHCKSLTEYFTHCQPWDQLGSLWHFGGLDGVMALSVSYITDSDLKSETVTASLSSSALKMLVSLFCRAWGLHKHTQTESSLVHINQKSSQRATLTLCFWGQGCVFYGPHTHFEAVIDRFLGDVIWGSTSRPSIYKTREARAFRELSVVYVCKSSITTM